MIDREFVEKIVADLREFAAPLLEPGLAPRRGGVRRRGADSLTSLRATIERFSALLPRLIEEAATDNRLSRRFTQLSAPIPRRARASRSPWDYQWRDERLLPTRWVAVEAVPRPGPDVLGYLLGLAMCLREQLDRAASRIDKHLADARSARSDASHFARREKEQIDRLTRGIDACRGVLERVVRTLRSVSGAPVPLRHREPRPYPISRAWRALRELAPRISDPLVALPEWLGAILDPGVLAPELSFLYQRWCGAQILLALERTGFRRRGDPTGALFLGELPIELVDEQGTTLTLWCEPRLIQGVAHESGLVPVRLREQQPDFVLLVPGEQGSEAYVLDATLSTDGERLDAKRVYGVELMFETFRLVAGVPVAAYPERSWAVAPLLSDICRLGDERGRSGVVPLHPLRTSSALDAWLADAVRRGRRWCAEAIAAGRRERE